MDAHLGHWPKRLWPYAATWLVWIAPLLSSVDAQCKTAPVLAPGDHSYSLKFEGITHDLIVHVPPMYDGRSPVPLVVDIHGSGSDAAQQLLFSGFPAVSDANGFILVAPTGYMNSWNGDIAFGAAYERKLNDVGFMKSLVGYVAELANIDRARVYATGLSNGAAMSNTLGCEATDVFAGIAPVADPLDIGLPTCMPAQPIAVIGFHGYDDALVPYQGGAGEGPELPTQFPSIPETLTAWGQVMACSGEPDVTPIRGKSQCEIYRVCGRGVQVGYCSLEGDHILYWQDVMNIAEYAWSFLSQFTLPLPDTDGDGINDQDDNCPDTANPDQADADGNCVGDACECKAASDCDDGVYCNGLEVCTDSRCQPGPPPCGQSETCDDRTLTCTSGMKEPNIADAGSSSATSSAGSVAAQGGVAGAGRAHAASGKGRANSRATAAMGGSTNDAAVTTAGRSPGADALQQARSTIPPGDTVASSRSAIDGGHGCSAGARPGKSHFDLSCMILLAAYAWRRRGRP